MISHGFIFLRINAFNVDLIGIMRNPILNCIYKRSACTVKMLIPASFTEP